MSLNDFLLQSDVVSRMLALMLLALSVGSWVVIAWKWRLLSRVTQDVPRSVAAFWQAPGFDDARQRKATAKDPEIRRYSPLVVPSDGNNSQADLQALVDHTVRVRRGGSWHTWSFYARCGYRNWNSPQTRYTLVGMRLVREISPQPLPRSRRTRER